MKNKVGKILFIILLICSSCSSIYRFSIDVQEPALVSLPISAQNVLILHNAVVQPEDFSDRTIDGKEIPAKYSLSLDSMVWAAIEEISIVLRESNFFNSIAIYQQTLREDTEWLSRDFISPDMQSEYYNMGKYDALLVIDRLLFNISENSKTIKTYASSNAPTAFIDMRVEGLITCSIYSYEKEKPLTTFSISDYVFTKSTVYFIDSTFLLKEVPESIIDNLSRNLGNQVATRFIPTWKTEKRLIFVYRDARLQEAVGYAADSQWKKAESIWFVELEKKMKPVDRTKIAFNLAVANEMQDNIEQAHSWAETAKENLKNADRNDVSQELEQTIENYISKLKERIQNNRLLDLQWGKEYFDEVSH